MNDSTRVRGDPNELTKTSSTRLPAARCCQEGDLARSTTDHQQRLYHTKGKVGGKKTELAPAPFKTSRRRGSGRQNTRTGSRSRPRVAAGGLIPAGGATAPITTTAPTRHRTEDITAFIIDFTLRALVNSLNSRNAQVVQQSHLRPAAAPPCGGHWTVRRGTIHSSIALQTPSHLQKQYAHRNLRIATRDRRRNTTSTSGRHHAHGNGASTQR